MTEFDPTRPYRYRNGDQPLAVFSLPSPTEHGDTLVSVSKSGRMCTHSVDGRVWCGGQDCVLDLVNIHEEVTVERWAVINGDDGAAGAIMFYNEEQATTFMRQTYRLDERYRVVRLTGTYTR